MEKPSSYDEVQVGDFTPIELGGHHMIIKGVREEKSSTGKDMIVVAFDFAKNDKQPNYFSDLFEKDIRPDKKWNFAGTKYIMVNDYQNPSVVSKDFKRFITSYESSNASECVWGKDFCKQFTGKKIGGIFGIVEEEYNGEVKERHRLRWFCSDEKADGAEIPAPKLLNNSASVSSDGFVNVPDSVAEMIPF
jgi:hypothetical protein